MVRNQSREFKPFVTNRIGEIQRATSPEQWRHVPGTAKPADLPTRGLSAIALAESKVWMEGPAFLKDDRSTWPATPPPGDNTKKTEHCERRTPTRAHMTRNSATAIINPKKFSSLKPMGSAIHNQLQTSNELTKEGPNPSSYRDIGSRDLLD